MSSYNFSCGFLISGADLPSPPKSGYTVRIKIAGSGYKQEVADTWVNVPDEGMPIDFTAYQGSWCIIGIYRNAHFDQSMKFLVDLTLTDQFNSMLSYTKSCTFYFDGTEQVFGDDIFQDITISGDIDVFESAKIHNSNKGSAVSTVIPGNARGTLQLNGKVWFNFNGLKLPLVEMKLRWPKFS